MGLQRSIYFPTESRPTWDSVVSAFQTCAEIPIVRMIDDLPAFPDEIPEPGWRELLIGLSGGMVTIRATHSGWDCMIWGNADSALARSWDFACWAIATAGQGRVALGDGESLAAGEFRTRSLEDFKK